MKAVEGGDVIYTFFYFYLSVFLMSMICLTGGDNALTMAGGFGKIGRGT